MKFFETPIWGFFSLILIAWATQRITAAWERRKKIEETKLDIFMSWQPHLAQIYAAATLPGESLLSEADFVRRKIEILGTLQIMGPEEGLGAGLKFFELAEEGIKRKPTFDKTTFHRSYTEFNFRLCCEIHREPEENRA
jgi:hypothetical protein